jgi:polyhydroxybutyrate depolymerase
VRLVKVLAERLDIDAGLSDPGLPAETSITRWTGCRPGGAVELWTVAGGGHVPTLSDSFPAAAMDYFDEHPKP